MNDISLEELGSIVIGRRAAQEFFDDISHRADYMALYQVSARKYLISNWPGASNDARLTLLQEKSL